MSLHFPLPISQSIQFDDEKDILIAYGTKISGELMRTLGEPTPPGRWFRIIKCENGISTIETKIEDTK